LSLDRIAEAARIIDPVALTTPQFVCEPLSSALGAHVVAIATDNISIIANGMATRVAMPEALSD